MRALLDCRLDGIQITDLARFFERVHGQVPIESLKVSWLIYGNGYRQDWMRSFVKRSFDLLASAALPFIFPAQKVHREYFGDGSMRQIAPVSPALHLGADRVLIVGTGRQSPDQNRARRIRRHRWPACGQRRRSADDPAQQSTVRRLRRTKGLA